MAGSPLQLGYRTRIKLVVGRRQGTILTGLYVPGSHRIADISFCLVHPPAVNRVIRFIKSRTEELGIPPYDEVRDRGEFRHLDLRYSLWSGELLVTLVTRHDEFPHGRELAASLRRRFPFVAGVVQNVHPEQNNVIWGGRFRLLAGRDSITERVGPLKLQFSSAAFSQANPALAQRLYETIVRLANLRDGETVLDLYCGVGPIALSLGGSAGSVWGVDEDGPSIALARKNARANGFRNCRFFAGDMAENVKRSKAALSRVNLVVLNPSRKGIQPDAMEATLSLGAPKIIYVSCNPETLVRDLDRMAGNGYRLRTLLPFDMFPQTEAVETVAFLARD